MIDICWSYSVALETKRSKSSRFIYLATEMNEVGSRNDDMEDTSTDFFDKLLYYNTSTVDRANRFAINKFLQRMIQ